MSQPFRTVLVTCVGGKFVSDIVAALRSAPDFDVRIVGCDANPETPGRILADHFAALPFAAAEPQLYASMMIEIAKREKVDVIVPLSEAESRVISDHRDVLKAAGVAVSVSAPAVVSMITDKASLMARLRDRNLHVLDFQIVDSLQDLDSALYTLGYPGKPVVLKPRRTSGARGVLIFDATADENILIDGRGSGRGTYDWLLQQMTSVVSFPQGSIAVRYVGGPVFDVDCVAVSGEATDIVPRLRQWRDPLSPASTGNRVDMNPAVIGYCRSLCRALEIDGAGDFDVALDYCGKPVVFDAGVRLSGSVGGAVVAGANIPAQLVRVLTGLPRQKFEIRDGCVVRPFMRFMEISADRQDDYI